MRRTHRMALRLALVAILGLLGLILFTFSDPEFRPPDDFVAFWAAGRVSAAGGNPYDPELILPVQQLANWQESAPYRVWYPPWVIPLLAPFGLMPYMAGRFLWFLITFVALVVSSQWLWEMFGGDSRWRYAAPLVALTFWPTVVGWKTGQISALVLVGVVGFLRYVDRRRDVLAGLFLALACIKPHLLSYFLIAAALWSLTVRRWKILGSAVASLGCLVAIAAVMRPSIADDFIFVILHDPPMQTVSTVGMALRVMLQARWASDFYPLLWVPWLGGLLWFVTQLRAIKDDWEWRQRAPLLLLVSVSLAPWGWIYDQVVLLVAVMQVALLLDRREIAATRVVIVAGYTLLMAVIVSMNVNAVDAFWYFWTPFPLLIWYVAAIAAARKPRHVAARGELALLGPVGGNYGTSTS